MVVSITQWFGMGLCSSQPGTSTRVCQGLRVGYETSRMLHSTTQQLIRKLYYLTEAGALNC